MSDEFKVQVSLNAPPPAQYAKGAMANFRGETVVEVKAALEEARDLGLLELAAEVEGIWTAAAGLNARTETVAAPAAAAPTADNVVPFNGGSPAPMCAHGKRTWKDGPNGRWHAWFCPARKGDPSQCDPVWANADGTPKD